MGKIEDEIRNAIEFEYGSVPKFADEIGMSPQTIYTVLKNGISGGSTNTVLPILAKLGIDANWVIRNQVKQIDLSADYVSVPLLARIAAGDPIEMEDYEDSFPIPARVHGMYPDAVLLKVEGESMNRILPNGCYALVNPCREVVHDGKPYAVCVNGHDATVKRVRRLNNGFELAPDSDDPTYRAVTYDFGDPRAEPVAVIGEVVYYVLPYDWAF